MLATDCDLTAAITLSAGAVIEYEPSLNGFSVVEIRCAGKIYRVQLQDLLDASPIDDAVWLQLQLIGPKSGMRPT